MSEYNAIKEILEENGFEQDTHEYKQKYGDSIFSWSHQNDSEARGYLVRVNAGEVYDIYTSIGAASLRKMMAALEAHIKESK